MTNNPLLNIVNYLNVTKSKVTKSNLQNPNYKNERN